MSKPLQSSSFQHWAPVSAWFAREEVCGLPDQLRLILPRYDLSHLAQLSCDSQTGSSKGRREAKRLFPFSELNLSGLILVHTGESVLSELAFVLGKERKKKKKKKEGNKHPLKSPFGSEGGKSNQADVSCGSATQQAPALDRSPPAHHGASSSCSPSPCPARKNC